MSAVKLLLGYAGLRLTFYKRKGGVLYTCLLERAAFRQCIIFLSETPIMRRGRLGSFAKSCPASAIVLRWGRFRVSRALGCPATKGADPTINIGLSQEWQGQNDSFKYNPY